MARKQAPLPSEYGPKTTAAEILKGRNLSGKVAIVTGGYSGIGLETARVLAAAGATVVVPARTPDKARAALENIKGCEQAAMDLADPASIDWFAREFLGSGRPLHMLVHSAAIMAPPELERDARGYESQFAINHLGHFQLATLLWPALIRAQGARVVSVSSRGHRRGQVNFDDPNYEKRPYDKWDSYGQSKTANALFALGLDKRGSEHGIRAFSLHPGSILTDIARYLTKAELMAMGVIDETGRVQTERPAGSKTVEQGAATSIWCATSPELEGLGGLYCEDCNVAEAVPGDDDYHGPGVRPWAMDDAMAERLWKLSERMTGAMCAA
jgi:NAD(P)-dependent dehydrogenase (short-subunit alcohol dehydrogenase family)